MTSSKPLPNAKHRWQIEVCQRSKRLHGTVDNNGVSEARVYNTDDTLSSISFAGASIDNLTYNWDANKNKTHQTNIKTSCLPSPCIQGEGAEVRVCSTDAANSYDSEDRLVGFNRTSGLTQSWNLSAVGDWNSVTTKQTSRPE